MERLLIDENRGQKAEFKTNVERSMNLANGLIRTFHKYQGFKRIETIEDFKTLCSGPIETFDNTIREFVQIPGNNGLKINIEKLCELYSIDRPGYIQTLDKYKLFSISIFSKFAQYMNFENGFFVLNHERINEKLDSFTIYTENQEQIELYKTWETLLNAVNELLSRGLTNSVNVQALCEMFPGLKYVDNVLYLNMEVLKYQILKLQ